MARITSLNCLVAGIKIYNPDKSYDGLTCYECGAAVTVMGPHTKPDGDMICLCREFNQILFKDHVCPSHAGPTIHCTITGIPVSMAKPIDSVMTVIRADVGGVALTVSGPSQDETILMMSDVITATKNS